MVQTAHPELFTLLPLWDFLLIFWSFVTHPILHQTGGEEIPSLHGPSGFLDDASPFESYEIAQKRERKQKPVFLHKSYPWVSTVAIKPSCSLEMLFH